MKTSKKIYVMNQHSLEDLIKTIENMQTADQFISSLPGEIIKNQTFKSLIKLQIDDSYYYLKVWWNNNCFRLLKDIIRRQERAVREAIGLLLLSKYGFNTPKLVAYGTVCHTCINKFSYIITEELNNVETLKEFLLKNHDSKIMMSVGMIVYSLHNCDISFGDLHLENILVSTNNRHKFFFLDWMAAKKSKSMRKKIYDIVNFVYWTEQIFENKRYLIDDFLNSYCSCWPKGKFDFEQFKIYIGKQVIKRGKYKHLGDWIRQLG